MRNKPHKETLVERLERTAEGFGEAYVHPFSRFENSLADYCAYLEAEADDPNRSDVERATIRMSVEQWRAVDACLTRFSEAS